MMAESNVEIFEQYKVKKILTTCPHCYHSFKNEYPQFGGEFQVEHLSELLNEKINGESLTSKNGQILTSDRK